MNQFIPLFRGGQFGGMFRLELLDSFDANIAALFGNGIGAVSHFLGRGWCG